MSKNKLEIKLAEGKNYYVAYLNGTKLPFIHSVDIKSSVGNLPRVIITMVAVSDWPGAEGRIVLPDGILNDCEVEIKNIQAKL